MVRKIKTTSAYESYADVESADEAKDQSDVYELEDSAIEDVVEDPVEERIDLSQAVSYVHKLCGGLTNAVGSLNIDSRDVLLCNHCLAYFPIDEFILKNE